MGRGNAIEHRGYVITLFQRKGSWCFGIEHQGPITARCTSGWSSAKEAKRKAEEHINNCLNSTTKNPRSAV